MTRAKGPAVLKAELAVAAQASLGEAPRWDERNQVLLFVDIDAGRVSRFEPATGAISGFGAGEITAIGLREDGGLILARWRSFATCEPTGDCCQPIGAFSMTDRRIRLNDGMVDPWGRFVAGSMDIATRRPIGALYRLTGDGSVEELLTGITLSNGIGWTADRGTMYYVDSATGALDAFALDESGDLGQRTRIFEFDPRSEGGPDGIALDSEGCIWVACWGSAAVRRITPAGKIDAIVELPATNVTSVAFGGRDLDELYITTARTNLDVHALALQPHAGDVFVAHPNVTGVPSARFTLSPSRA